MMPFDNNPDVREKVLKICADARLTDRAKYIGTRFLRSFGIQTKVYCSFPELSEMGMPPWLVWRAFLELRNAGYMTAGREYASGHPKHYFHVMFAGSGDEPAIDGMRRFIDAPEVRVDGAWVTVDLEAESSRDLPPLPPRPVVTSLKGCARDSFGRPNGSMLIDYVYTRDDLAENEKIVLSDIVRGFGYGSFVPEFSFFQIKQDDAFLVIRDLHDAGLILRVLDPVPAYRLADDFFDLPR